MQHASQGPFRLNFLPLTGQPGLRTAAVLLTGLMLALTGCGVGPVTTGPTPGGLVSGLSGVVHGGQSPVTSSTVRLMAPATNGYGGTPSVLATTTSDPVHGTFTLPTYTCPTPDQLVYIEASGGNSGTGNNTAIDEVALLGKCSTLSSSTTVFISELTTVAAAYGLAPFATVGATTTGIGTTSTNLTGLNNAFGPANNLIAFNNGYANSSTSTMVLPTQLLNTLGNILSACVNTSGPSSTPCSTLFTDTTVSGVKPINTFQAALNIALHPGANVSGTTGLYSLASTNPPFQPAMTSATAPNDFTLAIGYTNAGIAAYGTIDVAIDAKGNAWISDFNTTSTLTGLIEISPAGVFISPANGFGTSVLSASVGVGVDQNGLIWVSNNAGNALNAFNPDGSIYGTYTGVIGPNGQAIDGKGNIWTDTGGYCCNTFQELVNNLPTGYSLAPAFTAAAHFGTGICVTPTTLYETAPGASNESAQVTIVNLSTGAISGTIDPDSGGAGLSGCAVDHAGNVYLPDDGNFNGVEVYNSSGGFVTSFAVPSTYEILPTPQEMVIDGLGNSLVSVFIQDRTNTPYPAGFFTFNSSGTMTSPSSGYFPTTGASNSSGYDGFAGLTPVVVTDPGGMAADGSGNLWITGTNNGNTSIPNYITEVIGIAAPVVTPKATAVTNNTIGLRP
jgi:hypothetical protein